jgi:hypothetical protein
MRPGLTATLSMCAISIYAILTAPSLALAGCEHPPIPWSFGRTTSSTWRTDGSICSSTNNHPENIDKIEIESRAQNGIAGKSGPFVVAYKPNPGFKGTDVFSYAVTSNANYRKGPGWVARVTVHVIVK